MTVSIEKAIALHTTGRLAEAEQAYQEILESDPTSVNALKGLGVVLIQTQRFEDAYASLTDARNRTSDDPDLLNNLATAALQTGRLDEARQHLEQCLELAPQHTLAQANLGVILHKLGDPVSSAAALERALERDPLNVETLFNYSQTLRAVGRLDEAEMAVAKALKISPDHLSALIELATIQSAKGQYKEAEASYRRAHEIDSSSAIVRHNLGQVLLQTGQLKEGWAEFDWRWKTADFQALNPFHSFPKWNGRALSDDKLLVWPEQGVGDEVLFAGMLAQLRARTPDVVVACSPRLIPVFTRSFPEIEVVDHNDLIGNTAKLERVGAQLSLGDLCCYLRPNFGSFPRHRGYLQADPNRVRSLRTQYQDKLDGTVRIGLSWRSANLRSGAAKSMALQDLAKGLKDKRVSYVDLQYGDTEKDRDTLSQGAGIKMYRDPTIDPLDDLDAFAAQVAAMDLVITVSNTTAHIAGALGVPCWVLLPAGEGLRWYWFLDREDSPWYPSLRLFRQATPGDWAPVVQKVKEALQGYLETASGSS